MRAVFKYCGGCNPRYDRLDLSREIEKRLKGRFEFVPPRDNHFEVVVVIQGCETACADLDVFKGVPLLVITGPGDLDRLLREAESMSDEKPSP